MKSNRLNIYNIFHIVTFITLGLFIYQSYMSITNYQNNENLGFNGVSFVAWIMVLIVSMSIFVLLISMVKSKINSIIFFGFLYLLFAMISTYMSGNFAISKLPFQCINMGYWICVFTLFYYTIRHTKKIISYSKIYTFSFPILFFYFIVMVFSASNRTALLNPIYYLIFAFPLILLNKNKMIRYVFLAMLLIGVIFSYKRSAMLSFILATVVYFFYDVKSNRASNKKMFKVLFASVLFLCIGYYIYTSITSTLGFDWVSRMSAIFDDGGSGRLLIWENTTKYFFSNEPIKWIFGYGYQATYAFGAAHNDLLEILFDFGFVGLSVYVAFLTCIVKYFIKMKRANYANYPAFAFSLIIFAGGTMFSQVVIYPYWFIGMIIFWAITIADFDNIKEQKAYENTVVVQHDVA